MGFKGKKRRDDLRNDYSVIYVLMSNSSFNSMLLETEDSLKSITHFFISLFVSNKKNK